MNFITISTNRHVILGASFYVEYRESDGINYIKRPRTATSLPGEGMPVSNSLLTSGQVFLRSETAPNQCGHFKTKHLLTVMSAEVAAHGTGPEMLFPGPTASSDDPMLVWFPQDFLFRTSDGDPLVVDPQSQVEGKSRLLMPGLVLFHRNAQLHARKVVSTDDPTTPILADHEMVILARRGHLLLDIVPMPLSGMKWD